MNKEIKKYLKEFVAYMADDLHLEGLPDEMLSRACQLSDAATVIKEYLEGDQSKKVTKARLIDMEQDCINAPESDGCYLWERMPAP